MIAGRQPLFTLAVEELATGRRLALSSADAWTRIEEIEDGAALRFTGPTAYPALAKVTVGALEFLSSGPSMRARRAVHERTHLGPP